MVPCDGSGSQPESNEGAEHQSGHRKVGDHNGEQRAACERGDSDADGTHHAHFHRQHQQGHHNVAGRHAAKGDADNQEGRAGHQERQGGYPGGEELAPQDLPGPEQGHLQDGKGAAGAVAVDGIGRQRRCHQQREEQDKGQHHLEDHGPGPRLRWHEA